MMSCLLHSLADIVFVTFADCMLAVFVHAVLVAPVDVMLALLADAVLVTFVDVMLPATFSLYLNTSHTHKQSLPSLTHVHTFRWTKNMNDTSRI